MFRKEVPLEPIDDGEFEVATNCSCTEYGKSLVAKGNPAEEEPPELYG